MCSNVFAANMQRSTFFFLLISSCLVHLNTGTLVLNGTNDATVKRRSSHQSELHLTQNERNRRLIPYATYYVPGNQENSANAHYTSTLQHDSTGSRPEEEQREPDYTAAAAQSKSKSSIIVNGNAPRYVDYQNAPVAGYNYIPVAYIPGNAALPFTPPSSTQFYPAYYPDEEATENLKLYTTVRPTKYATTTPISGEKKEPAISYYSDYLLRPNTAPADENAFIKYYVPATATKQQHPNHKSGIVTNAEAKKSSYTPVLFSTPQSDYLSFRYSELYRGTPTPKYESSSATTPVVEITSPKGYILPHVSVSSSTTSSKHHSATPVTSTPSYSLAYEYPEAAQFAYAAPLPPAKTPQAKAIPLTYGQQSTPSARTSLKTDDVSFFPKPVAHLRASPKLHSSLKSYADADITDFSVDDIFRGYNLNKQLPERITPENIKDSIKTLSYILQMLQKADSITQFHKQPSLTTYSKDILDSFKDTHSLLRNHEEHRTSANSLQNEDTSYDTYDVKEELLHQKPGKDDQSTPGRAGIDYPIYAVIPETSFTCKTQRYKGFFADPDTKCQVWHYCDLNGGQASFLCPNGTIFNQAALTCDWWFNVKCAATTQLYVLNERLYKYIIPIRPSFPEDFSGPLVDQYLTEKFKETESQRKYKYPTNSSSFSSAPETTTELNLTALSEYDIPAHLLNENL